jgi:8-oxo-dGTP pyrophosphatase MutT (NUDIX family)
MLRFHATGDWTQERVRAAWVASSHRVPATAAALIDAAWAEALARPGVHLFDGPMCRLERWKTPGEFLDLELSRTSYKQFLGTNLAHPELADEYGPTVLANPVGVSPALLTGDGFLMLGRRNASVAYYPNRLHPFAGALEPRDGLEVFNAVRRELAEELALEAADIAEIRCTGIAEDVALRQPELIFFARTVRSREEIERRVDKAEHHASVAFPATPEGIEKMLRQERELTPVATAALLLYGRRAFGEEWFAAAKALP